MKIILNQMDYTEIRKYSKILLHSQGIDPSVIDIKYNLYYDETGNVKKFLIREDCFNVDANTHFVLGGIEGDNSISFEELKERLNIQKSVTEEIKSKHIYNGALECCLKSVKLEAFFDLIIEKGWHIHFQSLNLVYWSVVDILDSIKGISAYLPIINVLKAMLYRVVKSDIKQIIELFNKYTYPDLKNSEDVYGFMSDMKSLCTLYMKNCPDNQKGILILLIYLLDKGCSQSKAIFIQDEEESVLVKEFTHFYKAKIYTFINSNIVLDNEADVINALNDETFVVDGKTLSNYKFVDSKSEIMIQLSDIAVGIVAKYLHAIDYNIDLMDSYIKQFDKDQLRRFCKLNKIIKKSLDYNPVFIHQITSLELHQLLVRLTEQYGI